MAKYQVYYQRREIGTDKIIKGSVIHRASHVGQAIDWTAQELAEDEETTSFVILDTKQL